jgi:hypothetical protein
MNTNSVHSKLQHFISSEISFSEFEDILKNQATSSNPVRVGWITEVGLKRYYDMYWDRGAYVGGDAGGSAAKARMDMYNIQCLGVDGSWRTIDFNTVYKIRFNNKTYKVDN